MAAVVYAGSPVDAYLKEQGMGEMGYNEEERANEPTLEPEGDTSQAPAATATTTMTRHPAHDRLAALLVAHLNSPYAVAVATATATATEYAQNAELPATTKAQTATLSRRGQLILVSLFGTVIAYPGLTSASSSSTATSTWAVVVRLTPPLIILSGVVALWATSHSTTTSSSITRQIESQPIDLGTRIDLALQELTKYTIAFVQQWAEWETLSGRVVEVLDTLDKKRQRKQHRRHASSSQTRRRDSHVDIPEADHRVYEILHDLCAEIEEACSELFIEKYATANDGGQEQQTSGIDMQELKLLLEMYVPHTIPAPMTAQPEIAASSPRMSQQELIKARRRSWAAFPTTSSHVLDARRSEYAMSSPITRARSSETHAVNSLPGTPVRIRYPTSPIHASTPRNSTITPQAYISQPANECAGSNPGSASKVRGSRKRYSEQFIGHPSSPSSSSIGGFESYSPTNPSPLSLAMANASSSASSPSASQAMQRAATTGSHTVLYDAHKPEMTRLSLDSPRSLIVSGRLPADNYRRVQAHHPSSPSMSISPSWANSSPSISRIKQRPLSTPNGLGLDWRAYQDQPKHHNRTSEIPYAQQHLTSYSAHKRHSSSFSATRFAEYSIHNNADLSGGKARPTSLHLQASPKLLSPSSRAAYGGRFEEQYSDHHEDAEEDDEQEMLVDDDAKSKAMKAQEALCGLDVKRREILCIILALRAVPALGLGLSSLAEHGDQDEDGLRLVETCRLLGASLSGLSAILGKASSSLRDSCREHFGISFSRILLPTPLNNAISRESQEKAHSTSFPGQFPSSPLIEVESASPSPTSSTHHDRRRSSTRRRHSRSIRRGRSRSPSSASSDDQYQQGSFAPRQALPLHVREALAEYKESSEKIENLLADLAIDMHLNKGELEEFTEEYRGDTAAEEYLAELLERQEELRTNAQSLLSQMDIGRLALRRIRDPSRTSASSSGRNRTIEQEENNIGVDEEEDKDVSADMTFSDDFLNKRGSLSSTLSSSINDELINTPPLKPSYGNPEISLSSSTSSSAGLHDARNTISQLLLDPSNTNTKNMPAFLNFQEKLYETYTAPAVTAVEQTLQNKNKLSREERIAIARAKREALHDEIAAGGDEGPAQPTAKLELVQELKDVVKILRERRAPVMTPEQAEAA